MGHAKGHRSLPAACAGPAGRHRRVRILAALLALAPDALVLADARAPALLALAPDALVMADARAPALLALAPLALVLAEARPPALLALAPLARVLAQAALACRTFCFRPRCCPRPAAAGPFCRIDPRVCAARRSLGPGVGALRHL